VWTALSVEWAARCSLLVASRRGFMSVGGSAAVEDLRSCRRCIFAKTFHGISLACASIAFCQPIISPEIARGRRRVCGAGRAGTMPVTAPRGGRQRAAVGSGTSRVELGGSALRRLRRRVDDMSPRRPGRRRVEMDCWGLPRCRSRWHGVEVCTHVSARSLASRRRHLWTHRLPGETSAPVRTGCRRGAGLGSAPPPRRLRPALWHRGRLVGRLVAVIVGALLLVLRRGRSFRGVLRVAVVLPRAHARVPAPALLAGLLHALLLRRPVTMMLRPGARPIVSSFPARLS
jgi:hypothetical protein